MAQLEHERDLALRKAAETDVEIQAKIKAANLNLQGQLYKVNVDLNETRKILDKEVRYR
jgi:hypothetical protein